MTRNYQAETDASINALTLRILKNRQYGLISGTNPCKEIFLTAPTTLTLSAFYSPTVSKYKFSRAKWYEAEYDWIDYGESMAWCAEQFGPHPRQHDAWSRWWDRYEGKVYFRDERDYQWFVLRWGA